MDYRKSLILAASLFSACAFAGYAQLTPPPEWSPKGIGGSVGTFSYSSPANASTFSKGTVLTNASLNVGGRSVTIPASMRLSANASRVAAAAIYLNPSLRLASSVAGWLAAAGIVYSVADSLWQIPDSSAEVSDGYTYCAGTWNDTYACAFRSPSLETTMQQALQSCTDLGYACRWDGDPTRYEVNYGAGFTGRNIEKKPNGCPVGWYSTPAGCTQARPMETVSPERFEELLPDSRPMPDELPGVVWPASWPVEVPEIRPTFIPTGNPIPNPKFDPEKAPSPENQPWFQPGVRVVPAPTPSSPWNVDLQPVNRPVDKPLPSPDPVPDSQLDPDKPSSDSPREPKPDERDFCEKNPEVLACKKLEVDDDNVKLPVKDVDFDFQPEGGFSGNAVCPPDTVVTVSGYTVSVPWSKFCNSLELIRPMMLAMAWLMAAFILIGRR